MIVDVRSTSKATSATSAGASRLESGAIGIVQFEYGGTYIDAECGSATLAASGGYALHRIVPWG